MKRAWYAMWILIVLYGLSLVAELISNDKPLLLSFNDNIYFPILFYYPEDEFLNNGRFTRINYKELNKSVQFQDSDDNYMVFPIIPFGPNEIIDIENVVVSDDVVVSMRTEPHVATINLSPELRIERYQQAEWFFDQSDSIQGILFGDVVSLSDSLKGAINNRFANSESLAYEEIVTLNSHSVQLSLTPYKPRNRAPGTVRIRLDEITDDTEIKNAVYQPGDAALNFNDSRWQALNEQQQNHVLESAMQRLENTVEPLRINTEDNTILFNFEKEDVQFPFRPVTGHPFGIDNAGRDILSRVFYALRTSLSFGFLLVIVAMSLGTIAGGIQGYYGGKIDLFSQRFTEIWESMPFLYVLILLGSVYGQSFGLLIVVYGIFNWIGISYYMRAEFLRLRTLPYVEAARCLGLPDRKIALRHILPNSLVPLITFFPFSLVGAIGTLAALDYLGFGLPAPAPSWGELLSQAQMTSRWWLIFFPASALFIVMLLGVFIGEGIRAAFDPRRFTRLE